jgi:universal stress protein E
MNVSVAADWDFAGYEAIVRRAERTGADLIVAECHAGQHIGAGLRRLSDWELVRSSPVPVLLVRRPRPYHHPSILTALDPSHAFAKPAGLDGEILDLGTLMSKAFRGQLHALHAYLPARAGDWTRATASGVPVVQTSAAQAKIGFDELLRDADILPIRRHLIGGSPSEGVRKLARRVQADIVIVGTVSRSGLQRLLIGNTAERLLNTLRCDLLVVKATEFSSGVPTESRGARVVTPIPWCREGDHPAARLRGGGAVRAIRPVRSRSAKPCARPHVVQ